MKGVAADLHVIGELIGLIVVKIVVLVCKRLELFIVKPIDIKWIEVIELNENGQDHRSIDKGKFSIICDNF